MTGSGVRSRRPGQPGPAAGSAMAIPATGPSPGLSLLELLVASVIALLVAGTATSMWRDAIAQGRRMQARAAMSAALLDLERRAMTTLSFAAARGADAPAGDWPSPIPHPPARPDYWLSATACPHASLDDCVELRAAPRIPDAHCGTLILRSSGEWLAALRPDDAPVPLPSRC